MGFKVKDPVQWISQSGGVSKAKEGIVVAVVPAGERPSKQYWHIWKGIGPGLHRDHVSYVVLVGSRYYWPRVSLLKAKE